MTARWRTWATQDSKKRGFWEINITYRHADGTLQTVRKKAEVQTKTGANEEEFAIRRQLKEGSYGRKETKTQKKAIPVLAEFAKEFISDYAEAVNKHSEVEAKKGNLDRYLIPALGTRQLDQITTRDVNRLRRQLLERELNPKTINNALATLSKLLRYASEDLELITSIPKIRYLKVPEQDFDFLTFEEAHQLLKAAEYNPEWWGMIFFAMRTGVRYGELCELRWGDLDLEKGTMRVSRSFTKGMVTDRKNRSAYTVPLSPDTLAFLKRLRHLKGDLVFCKPDGGRHIHRRADVALKRCCGYAKLRPIGWHVLRHTFGSHLAMRGRSLIEIKELMGHKDIKSTLRYAHLMPETKHEAISVLDEPAPVRSAEHSQNMEEKTAPKKSKTP